MKVIPNAYKKVPMMFRAQVSGRSQLQYLDKAKKDAGEKQDVQLWAEEWIEKAEFIATEKAQDSQTVTHGAKSYQITWRFVTNGGQDDGMIRPVMGAYGMPFYPGSSMKGAFRNACALMELAGELKYGTCNDYCGDEDEITPGILRFLGAYPINDWTKNLVDLVHPQQGWQVKTQQTNSKPRGESAFALASLYKPTLRFSISSIKSLSDEQWQEVWQIWDRAIAAGLGSRVSAGYGQIGTTSHPVLCRVRLKGQGQAAKLINDDVEDAGEFRPNIFRAALRGHALRIFSGLTSGVEATWLVETLFGGIEGGEGTVGLLGVRFQESKLDLGKFGTSAYAQPCYNVEGDLMVYLARSLNDPSHEQALKKFIASLMQFAMVFGGFGKSWRRADHRLFFDEYYDDGYKALIGCHWQWLGDLALRRNVQVWRLGQVGDFIDKVRSAAQEWMRSQAVTPQPVQWEQTWREAWHPENVQVWGREATDKDGSEAIRWFHGAYREAFRNVQAEGSIYASDLTGKIGRIGRLWHRMYPVVELKKNSDDPQKPVIKRTLKFLELLTIFPDGSPVSDDFLDFLDTKPYKFERLWGNE